MSPTGPIFIGGLSASGKTELRLMLEAHPDLLFTRRTYLWTRIYGRFGDLSLPENFERCLQAILSLKHIDVLHPDPARLRAAFLAGPPTYERLFGLLHGQNAARAGKRRWGDQLGLVEEYVDPIFAAFPDARMIHMVRDPRGRFGEHAARARFRRAKVGWDTAEWRRSARLAAQHRARFPDRYLVVSYEALLGRTGPTLRTICRFLEEDFLPEMATAHLKPAENPAGDGRSLNGRPRPREIAFIESHASREMAALGYAPQPVTLTLSSRLQQVFDWPVQAAGMALWQVRGRQRKSWRPGA